MTMTDCVQSPVCIYCSELWCQWTACWGGPLSPVGQVIHSREKPIYPGRLQSIKEAHLSFAWLCGEAGLLAGARRRAMHGGDFLDQGSAPPSPAGSAMPGLPTARSAAQECLPGAMATAEPGSRSGRAVGWPLEVEEEGGGGGEGRGLVELEEARATIRRRRAAQALGPSQAASLPAAGGWMGRLQAAAAAAEAAAAAAAMVWWLDSPSAWLSFGRG